MRRAAAPATMAKEGQRSRIARMNYLVGDLQGCCRRARPAARRRSTSRRRATTLYVLGDLVNRGPDSLAHAAPAARPRRRRRPACSATTTCTCWRWPPACAARQAQRHPRRRARRPRPRRLARLACATVAWRSSKHGWLMLHAGVVPQWDLATTLGAGRRGRGALREPGRGATSWRRCTATQPVALARSPDAATTACASPSTR